MRTIIIARLTAIILLGLGACGAWCLDGVVSARPIIDRALDIQAVTLLPTGLVFGLGDCGAMSAQPMVDQARYVLPGTCPFSNSVAVAVVTRLGGDRFRLSLTAEHLPPPTTLRTKFTRHAYVAWLVHGEIMQGPLHIAALGLVATEGTGNYAGRGTVTISGVTAVIITAEPTAQAHMPIMPALTVLSGAGRHS